MAETIAESIEEKAQQPASVTTDAGSVTQRPLTEQIEADKYLAGKTAATKPHRGIRFTKLILPRPT